MGYYISPKDMRKEEWLSENAKPVYSRDIAELNRKDGWIPICLVKNPSFSAAAIAYDEQESARFAENSTDQRPRKWYVARREDVIKVCPEVESALA